MAITAETRTDIIELVVGMFGAAPGASVLSELAEAVDAGLSLKDLSITLGTSAVFKAEYPSFLTNTEFATNYLTDFLGGNPGEVSAANFTLAVDAVVALLNSGKSRGEVVYDVITAVSAVPETDTNFGTAAARLNNETEVAEYYSVTTQQSGDTLDQLKAVIVNVTSSDATVTSAKTSIDGGANVGKAFSLTTGLDFGTAFTGTTNNDTYIGVDSATDTADTINTGDSLDGGAGTDTLRMVIADNDANPITLANIENVEVTATAATGTISGASWTGVTGVKVKDTGVDGTTTSAVTFAGLGNVTIGLENVKVQNNNDTAATVGTSGLGTTGTLTLTTNGVGAAARIPDLVLDTNGTTSIYTKANITATGSNYLRLNAQADADVALTEVTVGGTGTLTLNYDGTNAENDAIKTIDASGNSGGLTTTVGNLTATVTGGSGKDNFTLTGGINTVNTGAGDDTVTAAGTLTVDDTIDGGEGTDTIGSTTALTNALVARLSNFEKLDVGAGNGVNHDVGNFTSLQAVVVGSALGGNVTVTDLVAGAGVEINSALTGGTLTIVQADSGAGSSDDTLSVSLNKSTAISTATAVIAAQIETVTLNSTSAGSSITHTLAQGTFANALSVVVNATTAGLTVTNLEALAINTLDASGSTAAVSITSGADTFTSAFKFTGGSKADTLNLEGATTQNGTIIAVGSGRDTVTLDSADAGEATIQTSATTAADAVLVTDDAGTANAAAFVTTQDHFDYNGALNNDSKTAIAVGAGATLTAAITADSDATVFLVTLAAGGNAGLEAALTTYAGAPTAANADAVETAAITALGTIANLDATFGASESVLIAIDAETNEAAGTANDGGTVVLRFTNSTNTANTISASEIELIAVFEDAALASGDFI